MGWKLGIFIRINSSYFSEILLVILTKKQEEYHIFRDVYGTAAKKVPSTHNLPGSAEYFIKQKTVSVVQNWIILVHAVPGQACVHSLFIYGIFNRWNINIW